MRFLRGTAAAAMLLVAGTGCAAQSSTASQPAVPSTDAPTASAPATPSAGSEQASPQTSAPETSASPSTGAIVDPDAKVIYLTFDDGPWVPYTEQMLKVLKDNDATATFFMVGEMAQQHPDLVAKVLADGHAVGNHTWNHPMLTKLSDEQIKQQMKSTAKAVGPGMGACMRPPYGATNEHIRSLMKSMGYTTYLWTDWAVDWEQPPIPQFLDSLEKATHEDANILLHDGGGDRPNTVKAVSIMLPRWKKMGYTFQSLPACTKPLA
jgi:peptidoglycan-N-acetylglucosamine deacetylase